MKSTGNNKAKKSNKTKRENNALLDTVLCPGTRNDASSGGEDDSFIDTISQALSSAADSIGDFDIAEGVSKVAGDVLSGIIDNIDL